MYEGLKTAPEASGQLCRPYCCYYYYYYHFYLSYQLGV